MLRKQLPFIIVVLFSFFISGCVTTGTYEKKVKEADNQAKELASLQQKYDKMKADRDQLKEAFVNATSDQTTIRQKVADLEAENTKLKENLAEVKKKEVEVLTESNTYKQLMQEMKGEIAKGQVTISELKGKLTLDVVDKILFASGQSEVKKEGLDVLQRVIDILKNVKDKSIRIEGHTDNVRIKGRLAKQYPTNWELSAARALNVTKYLQQQGIDPALLSATAFGEYKPVANNETPEGRAKNRRIAIILLQKE
ncbi:MAG: OmpA family protein [Syntrophaceae bacterium]|nr:OmpA family protein [Syntrophaceae bacterium]